jgi:MFS family permease
LSTVNTIVFAVVMLPIAKLSNIIGRGYTIAIAVSLCTISYALMASASGFSLYAAGSILHWVGLAGTTAMISVIISDITTTRWRGYVAKKRRQLQTILEKMGFQ